MKLRLQSAQGVMAGAALAAVMGASSAHAFPLFQVSEGSLSGTPANTVVADQLAFSYGARIAQTISGGDGLAGSGDIFREAGFISMSGYANGSGNVDAYLNGVGTAGYKMYATFVITGEADYGTGSNLLHAGFQSVSLSLYADVSSNTGLSATGSTFSGATAVNVGRTNTTDDVLLGTATMYEGEANIYNGLASGDFGVDLLLSLTTAGKNLFSVPSNFYSYMRIEGTTGKMSNGTALLSGSGYAALTGGGTVSFSNYPSSAVPEPGSALLVGGGLLGLYATSRRRRKQA